MHYKLLKCNQLLLASSRSRRKPAIIVLWQLCGSNCIQWHP